MASPLVAGDLNFVDAVGRRIPRCPECLIVVSSRPRPRSHNRTTQRRNPNNTYHAQFRPSIVMPSCATPRPLCRRDPGAGHRCLLASQCRTWEMKAEPCGENLQGLKRSVLTNLRLPAKAASAGDERRIGAMQPPPEMFEHCSIVCMMHDA